MSFMITLFRKFKFLSYNILLFLYKLAHRTGCRTVRLIIIIEKGINQVYLQVWWKRF